MNILHVFELKHTIASTSTCIHFEEFCIGKLCVGWWNGFQCTRFIYAWRLFFLRSLYPLILCRVQIFRSRWFQMIGYLNEENLKMENNQILLLLFILSSYGNKNMHSCALTAKLCEMKFYRLNNQIQIFCFHKGRRIIFINKIIYTQNPIWSNRIIFNVIIAAGIRDLTAEIDRTRKIYSHCECWSGMNDNAVLLSMKRCGAILLLYCYLIRFQDNLTCRNRTSSSSSFSSSSPSFVFIEYVGSRTIDVDRYCQ